MAKIDIEQRDAEIRASDEHWSALAERHNLSRASIYRIQRKPGVQPEAYAQTPRQHTKFKDVYSQLASSGLTRHGGQITEEFQRELQEDSGARIYTEMAVHPVVAAVLFAIKMSLRRVKWWVEPASDSADDKRKAEFVEECMADMAQSWSEVMSQIFNMLKFGWQLSELVYKKRLGVSPPAYVPDPARSRFTDGLIGWRRWQFINPTSLMPGNQWDFDEHGRVQGFNQTAPPDYIPQYIPMEKALLFRTDVEWDNPEGTAILRPMYQPWYYATNLAEVEAIGAERLGVGLPVIYLGRDCSMNGSDSDYAQAQDIVVNVRTDEQMGVVIPKPKLGTGESGEGILFELVSPPSRGFVDFSEVIERYEKRMAMTCLSQFIFLGMRNVGTQALAETSTDFFVDAVGAWSDAVGDVINRFAIPRLLALNPFGNPEELPELKHSEIGVPDLQTIAGYINQLVGAQMIMPYDELERHLLEIAGLPERPEGEEHPQLQAPEPEEPEEEVVPDAGPQSDESKEEQEEAEKEEQGPEVEEDAEMFALRTAPGGPKWERATNAYQNEMQAEWDAWAERTARELAQIDDEQERDKHTEEAVAAIIAALILLGRRRLPEAWALGLAGDPTSPEGLALLADAMAGNENYLLQSLGPATVEKMRTSMLREPSILGDVASLRSVFGTMRARVGQYAGQFWNLIQRGALDRIGQRPDAGEIPIRMVLDPNAKHCEDCPQFAKEYANFEAFLTETGGRVPGQFQCGPNCRCHLEVKLPGKGWSRW